jgi:hypothetical protein
MPESFHPSLLNARTLKIVPHGRGFACKLVEMEAIWGYGLTPKEAIGNCVNAHAEVFGIKAFTPKGGGDWRDIDPKDCQLFLASIAGEDTVAEGTSFYGAIGSLVETHLGMFGIGSIIWPDTNQTKTIGIEIEIELKNGDTNNP